MHGSRRRLLPRVDRAGRLGQGSAEGAPRGAGVRQNVAVAELPGPTKGEFERTSPPSLTRFLMDLANRAMGDKIQIVAEDGLLRPDTSLPNEQGPFTGDDFLNTVDQKLLAAPVLAIPSWDRRHPRGPCAGQDLVERIQLAGTEHPLGLVLPIGSIANIGSGQRLREALLCHRRSLLVIEAYGVVEGVHPQFLVAFVVLHPERVEDRPLARFVRVPNRNLDQELVLDDTTRLLRMRGGSRPSGFVYLGQIDPYSPLTYQHYDPVLRARKGELRSWGEGTTVGQLFELLVPARIPPRQPTTPGSGHHRFVTGRSISLSGEVEIEEGDDSISAEPVPLRAGDLVMRSVFRPTDFGGLRVAEIRETDLPAAARAHVLVLRPKRELSDVERILYLRYLQSSLVKELAVGLGAAIGIPLSVLHKLYLPVPEESLLEAVSAIAEAGRVLRQWGDEAAKALDSIFALESPAAARAALIERGRESRLRVDAARSVDEFDYRVRTQYPYPVAYRWRSLTSIASKEDPQQTLREIRFGFEHILAFAGCLAAAVARQEGLDLPELRLYGAADEYKTFISTWTDILDQVGKNVRRGQTDNPLLVQLSGFREDSAIAGALARLIEYRHAESHTLSIDEEGLASQLMEDVQTLVEGLRFLADYELVEIVDTRWDLILKHNTVRYRAYVGDHQIVPVRTVTVAQSEIDKDSLYIREKDSKEFMAPLRPYLLGHRCDKCKQWATYYLHKTMGQKAKIKSIEHGHDNDVTGLPEVLRAVAKASGT